MVPISLHSQQLVKTYTILHDSFLKQYGSGKQIDLFGLARQVLYQLSHPPAYKVAFKVINKYMQLRNFAMFAL